jgi:hypothetical protein
MLLVSRVVYLHWSYAGSNLDYAQQVSRAEYRAFFVGVRLCIQ